MMGVYIKGMEMPKDGEQLCININPDGKVCINLDLSCEKVGTAVPVPLHGRLIDADALDEIIQEEISKDYNKEHRPKVTWSRAFELFEDMVLDAPTIIPAEEAKDTNVHTYDLLYEEGGLRTL